MTVLHKLPKITIRKKKRLGQGHGSKKGKTAGRGTKGQNSRGRVSLTFSSGVLSMVKRLPLIRGKYRNKSFKNCPLILNLEDLKNIPKGTEITVETLVKYNLVKKEDLVKRGVKILGTGKNEMVYKISVPCSARALK